MKRCLYIWLTVTMTAGIITVQANAGDQDHGLECTNTTAVEMFLPDTGQQHCFDDSRLIPCPKPGEAFFGEDGNYLINKPSYSVIEQGQEYIVLDQVTGLTWRKINSQGATWSEALDAVDSQCRKSGEKWRLPTIYELETLASFGSDQGIVFAVFNAAGDVSDCFWSVTSLGNTREAIGYCSAANEVKIFDIDEKLKVLAVKGASLTTGRFLKSTNGTVTDETSGLMFQADEQEPMTWKQALKYCQGLQLGGFTDWRLPNIKELLSIVVFRDKLPLVNSRFFPGARAGAYWSSTTCEDAPYMAWVVDFSNGKPYRGGFKNRRYFVRAVRGGRVLTRD